MEWTERVSKVFVYSGLNKSEFEREVGLARGSLAHYLSGRYDIGTQGVAGIFARWPEISPNWLLLGKGPMFNSIENPNPDPTQNAPFDAPFDAPFNLSKTKSTNQKGAKDAGFDAGFDAGLRPDAQTKSIDSCPALVSEPEVPYGSKVAPHPPPAQVGKATLSAAQPSHTPLGQAIITIHQQPQVITEDTAGRPNIALVNTPAMAGYAMHIADLEYFKPLPKFSLPFAALRNGTFRAFTVRGLSMYDTLFDGDVVLTEYVDHWLTGIRDGLIYIVVTDNQVFIKRVSNRAEERGYIVLQSDNFEEEPTFTLPAESIREIWKVVFNITPHMPNRNIDMRGRMADLEGRMAQLEGRKPNPTL